ncbi:hypothetical protein [Micromonospora sp. NPDC005113]
MRNVDLISTVMFGSMPFTAVWEVAIHAVADGAPPVPMVAAGAAPQVIAAVGLALWYLDPMNRRREATVRPAGPTPQQMRRQLGEAARRKELAR